MTEPPSLLPQRFHSFFIQRSLFRHYVTEGDPGGDWFLQVLNVNEGTWKSGGDLNIRRQGVSKLPMANGQFTVL